jgi:hypothetical protein
MGRTDGKEGRQSTPQGKEVRHILRKSFLVFNGKKMVHKILDLRSGYGYFINIQKVKRRSGSVNCFSSTQ